MSIVCTSVIFVLLTLAFGHDADGRLASSVLPDRGLAAYEADPAGNAPAAPVRLPRLPAADGGLEDDPAEVGRVVAVRVAEGWALGYDADGNLLSKSDTSNRHGGVSWRYAYDGAGRLAEVWRDDGAGEIQVGAYGYDVLGRRVTRRTWALDGSGLDERVAWDGDVPAERRRARRPALEGASSRTADVEAVAVRTYAYQGFEPVAVLDGAEGAAVLECDQVGQPRLAVDRAGALVWEGRFDAWGNDVEVGPVRESGVEVEARFPGQVADEESGLRYNRFRYYDPETRTYGRGDPIGLAGGIPTNGYVKDPLHFADTLGLAGCNWKKPGGRVGTDSNTAFFWSGRSYRPDGTYVSAGPEMAADIARSRGGTTLETLIEERGIKMPDWETGNPAVEKAWEDISREYAEGVSGEVRAVVGNSLREGNIWQNVELPRLKSNSLVTKITEIEPLTNAERIVFKR